MIETETASPIESGIDEDPWTRYAFVDDGEHALVVGVSLADEQDTDGSGGWRVRYSVYACGAGFVHTIGYADPFDPFDQFCPAFAIGVLCRRFSSGMSILS